MSATSSILKTGAAMTAAVGTTMLGAATLHRGSPWASMNAMATAVGAHTEPMAKFDRVVTPVGIGVLVGGLVLWAGLYEAALRKAERDRSVATGALAALGGFLVDRFVLRREVVPSFVRSMGPIGTLAKYTALGLAASLRL